MSNKFDGPSFVNPAHTSFGQGKQSYQIPNLITSNSTKFSQALEEKKKQVGKQSTTLKGVWKEESPERNGEDANLSSTVNIHIQPVSQQSQADKFAKFKKKDVSILQTANISAKPVDEGTTGVQVNQVNQVNQFHQVQQTSSSFVNNGNGNSSTVKQENPEYETKVLEEILQPIGASLKPSDQMFKNFVKRIKTLNNEVIFSILYEKIADFEILCQTDSGTKTLTKALFLVEYLLQNKVDEFLNYQKTGVDNGIFEVIRQNTSLNKKILELSSSIVNNLGGTNEVSKSKQSSQMQVKDVNPVQSQPKSMLTTQQQLSQPIKQNSSNNSLGSNGTGLFDFAQKKPTQTNNDHKVKKGEFSFIKSKQSKEVDVGTPSVNLSSSSLVTNPILSKPSDNLGFTDFTQQSSVTSNQNNHINYNSQPNQQIVFPLQSSQAQSSTQEKKSGGFSFIKSKKENTDASSVTSSNPLNDLNQLNISNTKPFAYDLLDSALNPHTNANGTGTDIQTPPQAASNTPSYPFDGYSLASQTALNGNNMSTNSIPSHPQQQQQPQSKKAGFSFVKRKEESLTPANFSSNDIKVNAERPNLSNPQSSTLNGFNQSNLVNQVPPKKELSYSDKKFSDLFSMDLLVESNPAGKNEYPKDCPDDSESREDKYKDYFNF